MAKDSASRMSKQNERIHVSPLLNFVFRYRPREENTWTELAIANHYRSFTFNELSCGTEYEFILMAYSIVGNSSSSNTVTTKTKGSPPEYINSDESDITVSSTSCTIYLTHWQDRGCAIQQYIFRFRTSSSADWIIAGGESPPKQDFLLGGLHPATSYVVRVTAISVAGSTSRDYSIETEPFAGDYTLKNRVDDQPSLMDMIVDPRIAIPITISALAIYLTIITVVLIYRFRSQYSRPPVQQSAQVADAHNYVDDVADDNSSISLGKRMVTMDQREKEYDADDVSPYAVFPMPKSYSSTRRMKTFVVDKNDPVEMSNYAGNHCLDEPTYEYVAPCGEREYRPRRIMVPKVDPQSVFVPIQARRNLSYGNSSSVGAFHRPAEWNNQETLAITQRL